MILDLGWQAVLLTDLVRGGQEVALSTKGWGEPSCLERTLIPRLQIRQQGHTARWRMTGLGSGGTAVCDP